MTKILYALWNYPQLSESYIAAEIEFALACGMTVEVWSDQVRLGDVPAQVTVHRGTLTQAVNAFRPHVLHTHYLATAEGYLKELPALLPVTIRGHSFDWNPEAAIRVLQDKRVQKLYLFPHFAESLRNEKVVPLPVAFSSKLYGPEFLKDRMLVVRAAAGRPDKGLDDFLSAAELCPGLNFVLCVAEAGGPGGGPEFLKKLAEQASALPNLEFRENVSQADVAELVRRAGVYLDTSDPRGHPFGMPISIAEALATGCYTLARRVRGAAEYLGGVGAMYDSVAEAAKLIHESLSWDADHMTSSWVNATLRGAEFRAEAVLRPVIEHWRTFGW